MAVLVIFLSAVLMSLIPLARWWEGVAWARRLVAYRLQVPAGLSGDEVARWLAGIAASTHPTNWALLPLPPVVLELSATPAGTLHYLLVDKHRVERLLAGLRASLPGARITEDRAYLHRRPRYQVAGELGHTSQSRPLAVERAEAVCHELLSALHPVGRDAEIRVQVLMTSAGTPRAINTEQTLGGRVISDEDRRALERKHRDPLLRVVARVGVAAPRRSEALALFGRVWATFHGLNAPGVRLVRRWLPSAVVALGMDRRAVPMVRWPLLLGTRELVGVVGIPIGKVSVPGLTLTTARQLPPPPSMAGRGVVVAMSNAPGLTSRPLTLTVEDRLRHVWLNAPTGGGKSTLMARLALQDIAAGYGCVVVDPKNDLAEDILARIPEARQAEVISLDPSELARPIGFNLLGAGQDEHSREQVVDHVVHLFAELWRSSWGPRTSDVLRSSLLTLSHTRAADGSRFTLCEVPELLTNDAFRRSVTRQPSVPASVRGFWSWYEQLSESERTTVIGPGLNKLRSLTSRTALRLMLGQSEGIDLQEVFTKRRILVVKLSKGIVGEDTAALLAALLIAGLWQAALSRMAIPRERRRPVFMYLDELVDLARLPVPLESMLAQARGLGVSLTLASQYASQLPDGVRAAVLGTVRTQITMQCDEDDARLLGRRFAPLTADDLQGLAAHEIAMRPCVGGQTLAPVTGTTVRLEPPTGDAAALAEASRQRLGLARAEVEAGLLARLQPTERPTVGRGRRGRP